MTETQSDSADTLTLLYSIIKRGPTGQWQGKPLPCAKAANRPERTR